MINIGDPLVNRYKVLHLLAEGGMSHIYLAEDIKLNHRLVVLKVLKTKYIDNIALLREEAKMLISLNHPHLPIIYDYITIEDGYELIVMEYVEGENLTTMIQYLNEKQKIKVLMQMASALTYLHTQIKPIVHSDLKPANVIVDNHLNIKLIDFGISQFSLTTSSENTKSQQGKVQYGTPSYMAPELLTGEETTYKADLYSFGLIILDLFHCHLHEFEQCRDNIEFYLRQHRTKLPTVLSELLIYLLQPKAALRQLTFKNIETQLSHYYATINDEDIKAIDQVFTTKNINIALINLNKGAGSTVVALALAQLIASEKEVVYVEVANRHSNFSKSSYGQLLTEQTNTPYYSAIKQKNLTCYYNACNDELTLEQHLETLTGLTKQYSNSVVIYDLSSLSIKFDLLAYYKRMTHLIVVTTDDVVIMNDSELVNAINNLNAMTIPLIHIANKTLAKQTESILSDYLTLNDYISIPYIMDKQDFKNKLSLRWLHPKTLLMKQLKTYINKLLVLKKGQ